MDITIFDYNIIDQEKLEKTSLYYYSIPYISPMLKTARYLFKSYNVLDNGFYIENIYSYYYGRISYSYSTIWHKRPYRNIICITVNDKEKCIPVYGKIKLNNKMHKNMYSLDFGYEAIRYIIEKYKYRQHETLIDIDMTLTTKNIIGWKDTYMKTHTDTEKLNSINVNEIYLFTQTYSWHERIPSIRLGFEKVEKEYTSYICGVESGKDIDNLLNNFFNKCYNSIEWFFKRDTTMDKVAENIKESYKYTRKNINNLINISIDNLYKTIRYIIYPLI